MDGLFPLLLMAGLVWWFLKRKKEEGASGSYPNAVLIDAKNNVYIRPNSPAEDRIAALHREATAHKGKDWERAIACLREADSLAVTVKTSYAIKHFLRLPLFLQQAGQFEQSTQEFNRLLAQTDDRVSRDFAHQAKSRRNAIAMSDHSQIYAAMATAYKREGLLGQAEEFKTLSETLRVNAKKKQDAQMASDMKKAKKKSEERKKRLASRS